MRSDQWKWPWSTANNFTYFVDDLTIWDIQGVPNKPAQPILNWTKHPTYLKINLLRVILHEESIPLVFEVWKILPDSGNFRFNTSHPFS